MDEDDDDAHAGLTSYHSTTWFLYGSFSVKYVTTTDTQHMACYRPEEMRELYWVHKLSLISELLYVVIASLGPGPVRLCVALRSVGEYLVISRDPAGREIKHI